MAQGAFRFRTRSDSIRRPGSLGDQDHPPGRLVGQRGPDRDFRLSGKRRKTTDQGGFLTLGRREVKPGVIGEIGFRDGGPAGSRQLEQQGKTKQPVAGQLPDQLFLVPFLIGSGEAVQRQGRGDGVIRQVQDHPLIGEDKGGPAFLRRETVTEGDPIVISTKDDLPASRWHRPLAEVDDDLPAPIDDPAAFPRMLPKLGLDRRGRGRFHDSIRAQPHTVCQFDLHG